MAKMSFDDAMMIAEKNYTDDVFMNEYLAGFLHAVKCIIKTHETGKGVYIVKKRHIKTIDEFMMYTDDVTGTLEVIFDHAFSIALDIIKKENEK